MAAENEIYGVIAAHGALVKDKIVVIPDGIRLLPLVNLGKNLMLRENDEIFGKIDTYDKRKRNFEIIGKKGVSHIYNPGDAIYDMDLEFLLTFPISKIVKIEGKYHEPHVPENERTSYYSSGIITDGKMMPKIKNKMDDNGDCIPTWKSEAYEANDENIYKSKNIGGTRKLSQVLARLVRQGKQGNYYIMSCRGVTDDDDEDDKGFESTVCGLQDADITPVKTTVSDFPQPVRQQSTFYIYQNFGQRVKNLEENDKKPYFYSTDEVLIDSVVNKILFISPINIKEYCDIILYDRKLKLYNKLLERAEVLNIFRGEENRSIKLIAEIAHFILNENEGVPFKDLKVKIDGYKKEHNDAYNTWFNILLSGNNNLVRKVYNKFLQKLKVLGDVYTPQYNQMGGAYYSNYYKKYKKYKLKYQKI